MIGGSMVAAAFGTALGNPLTFPFIWLTTFQIGQLILGPAEGAVSPQKIEFSVDILWTSFSTLWPTIKPMLLGGVILGLVAGGITYVMVRSAVMMSRSLRKARLAAAAEARTERARTMQRAANPDTCAASSPGADDKSPS